MIGARRRRIVAVIGGDDQQVSRLQARQQRRQPLVESLEVLGVAADVVAMPVDGVEIDEVGEDEPASAEHRARGTPRPCRASSLVVWIAAVIPCPAKRSSILPIASTGMPAALSLSSSVSSKGGSAKSRRFEVRV